MLVLLVVTLLLVLSRVLMFEVILRTGNEPSRNVKLRKSGVKMMSVVVVVTVVVTSTENVVMVTFAWLVLLVIAQS